MMKINLLGNLLDPLVEKPSKEKATPHWEEFVANSPIIDPYVEDKKDKSARKRKITMCGCGNHPVNPKKDIYKQHNHWMAQQHLKTESHNSNLYGVKSIGTNIKKYVPTYDFSGEEFEITAEEIRKFKK